MRSSDFSVLKKERGRGENEYPIQLKRRKNKCIGQIVRRKGFLHITEGKKMEEKRRRGGRSKQLSDDLEEKKIYRDFKAKELDRSV
jgi:hypothetical protein